MWVFGYGSLMWDGWEAEFGCTRREQAALAGFGREFNKSSVRNWGSEDTLCPTLGLDPDDGAECTGLAFEFPDSMCDRLCKWLLDREGSSFSLEQEDVLLQSGDHVRALVAINDQSARTYIGNQPAAERARLAKSARGTSGACVDYLKNVRAELSKLGIIDPVVGCFWAEVRRASARPQNK